MVVVARFLRPYFILLVEHNWDSLTKCAILKFVNPTIHNRARFLPGGRVMNYHTFTVNKYHILFYTPAKHVQISLKNILFMLYRHV